MKKNQQQLLNDKYKDYNPRKCQLVKIDQEKLIKEEVTWKLEQTTKDKYPKLFGKKISMNPITLVQVVDISIIKNYVTLKIQR